MGLTQTRGKRGEDLAAAFLRKSGFRILARNIRTPYGELDIVGTDGTTTMFVEVKYRTSARFGNPEDAVVGRKHEKLTKSAEWYVQEHDVKGDYRMDVVTIQEAKPKTILHHLRDV